MPKDHDILWDGLHPYIIEKDRIVFCHLNCSMYCYDPVDSIQKLLKANPTFQNINNSMGYRFDGENHNWYVIDEYLSLSFSFMAFVIKEKIEKEEMSMADNMFDIVPYNYQFNKSTAFIDSEFVRSDHEFLE